MVIYYSFQNAKILEEREHLSEPQWTFLHNTFNLLPSPPMQECQACKSVTHSQHERVLVTICETAQIGLVHKQQHPQFSRATRMRHGWVHNLEKEGDILINMPHTYSTEGAIRLILGGATVNERWRFSASSRRYSASLDQGILPFSLGASISFASNKMKPQPHTWIFH